MLFKRKFVARLPFGHMLTKLAVCVLAYSMGLPGYVAQSIHISRHANSASDCMHLELFAFCIKRCCSHMLQ